MLLHFYLHHFVVGDLLTDYFTWNLIFFLVALKSLQPKFKFFIIQ